MVQSGSRFVFSKLNKDAPRVLIAKLQSGSALGKPGSFRELIKKGLGDVWPDDGRLVDLIRTAGHCQGTL